MIFISLRKLKKKPDKESIVNFNKMMEDFKEKGIKVLSWYWTLGRYDVIQVFEAANEKEAVKFSAGISEFVTSETLVAIPREEAIKLL